MLDVIAWQGGRGEGGGWTRTRELTRKMMGIHGTTTKAATVSSATMTTTTTPPPPTQCITADVDALEGCEAGQGQQPGWIKFEFGFQV